MVGVSVHQEGEQEGVGIKDWQYCFCGALRLGMTMEQRPAPDSGWWVPSKDRGGLTHEGLLFRFLVCYPINADTSSKEEPDS